MKATTYLILEATRSPYGLPNPESGLRPVKTMRVAGSRANRPSRLTRDQVAVKVTVEVDNSVFNPLALSAVVTVPGSDVLRGPLGVEVENANPQEEDEL